MRHGRRDDGIVTSLRILMGDTNVTGQLSQGGRLLLPNGAYPTQKRSCWCKTTSRLGNGDLPLSIRSRLFQKSRFETLLKDPSFSRNPEEISQENCREFQRRVLIKYLKGTDGLGGGLLGSFVTRSSVFETIVVIGSVCRTDYESCLTSTAYLFLDLAYNGYLGKGDRRWLFFNTPDAYGK